jgi:hypothetical protein
LGESAGEVKLREEDTKKELRVKTLEIARNDETMLLVWAMPPLPAARLAHIGWFGLGAFAEDEGKEHADTEEEERSNEVSGQRAEGKSKRPTNRHVMDTHGQTGQTLRTDRRSQSDLHLMLLPIGYLSTFFSTRST